MLGARGAAQAWAAVSIIAMMAQDAPGSSPWRQEAAVPTLMMRHARGACWWSSAGADCARSPRAQSSSSSALAARRAVPRGRCSLLGAPRLNRPSDAE